MDQPQTENQIDNQPPTEDPIDDPIGGADRYCRSCLYCLGDLADPDTPGVCPECGKSFDKADPRATLPNPRKRRPFLLRWPALALVGILLFVFMARSNLLPHPIAGNSGTLWEWRYYKYGYHDGLWWWVGDSYGTRILNRGALRVTMSLHAGIARKVVAIDANDGHHAFTVERNGDPPVWSLRIDDHDLTWPESGMPELIRAINRTREHRFGVTIYSPPDSPRLTPPGPIEVSGTEADIFWAYVNAYGLIIDLPERVPRTTDGWHPTLEPGQTVDYPPSATALMNMRNRTGPTSLYRGR